MCKTILQVLEVISLFSISIEYIFKLHSQIFEDQILFFMIDNYKKISLITAELE